MTVRVLAEIVSRGMRDLLFAPFALFFPRSRKKIVFGAWRGDSFSCNPKYFMLYLLERTDFTCVWIGKPYLRDIVLAGREGPRVRFAAKGSLKALWHILTAGTFVFNINYRSEIADLPVFGRVRLLNLWHGIPFKKIGCQQIPCRMAGGMRRGGEGGCLRKARGLARRCYLRWLAACYPQRAWTSVSSRFMGEILEASFPGRFALERTLGEGLPRNDFLIRESRNPDLRAALKRKYAAWFGISAEKRWYLYLPTFRLGRDEVFSFAGAEGRGRLERLLAERDAVIVEKQHPRVLRLLNLSGGDAGPVHILSAAEGARVDVQELLLVSDLLITDYSSCFFDFSLLQRPVIHFAYDYEEYVTRDTGALYDLREVCAGPVAATESELLKFLEAPDEELLAMRGGRYAETVALEKGRASEALCREILMGDRK